MIGLLMIIAIIVGINASVYIGFRMGSKPDKALQPFIPQGRTSLSDMVHKVLKKKEVEPPEDDDAGRVNKFFD